MAVTNAKCEKIDDLPDYDLYHADYAGRTWLSYRWLVRDCITYGWPGTVLDLGCGGGLFTECATRYGLKTVGVEGSQMALTQARTRFAALQLVKHDLRQPLPFPDNTFESVVCNQVIEHLKPNSASRVLRECYRVLRPNGVLMVHSPSCFNPKEAADPCHINLFSPSRLRSELLAIGFAIQSTIAAPRAVGTAGRLGQKIGALLYNRFKVESLAMAAGAIAYKPASDSR